MRCINKTNPAYNRVVNDATKLGYDPLLFEVKASIWASNKGKDIIPNLQDLEPQIKGLLDIMSDLKIDLKTIEEWQKITGKKVAQDVDALADPINQIIAFKQGQLTKEKLSEEVVHIMMAHSKYGNQKDYEKALKYVERTDEWKKDGQRYTERYESEELAKREILHKIGAEYLLNEVTEKPKNSLQRVLTRLWDSFMALFDNKQRIKNYMAKLMKRQNLTNEVSDETIYYSLAKEKARQELKNGDITRVSKKDLKEAISEAAEEDIPFFQDLLKLIEEDFETIYKRNDKYYTESALINEIGKTIPDTIANDEEFNEKINEIKVLINKRKEALIKKGKYTEEANKKDIVYMSMLDTEEDALKRGDGLLTFLKLLRKDALAVVNVIQDPDTEFNEELFSSLLEFFGFYEPMLESLELYLLKRTLDYKYDPADYDAKFLPKVAEQELLEAIRSTLSTYNSARSLLTSKTSDLSIDIMRKIYKERFFIEDGSNDFIDNKINERLYNVKQYPENAGRDYRQELRKINRDINIFSAFAQPVKDVMDNTIKAIGSLLMDVNMNVLSATNNWIKTKFKKLSEYGFDFKNLDFAIERDEDGNLTGYLNSKISYASWDKAKKEFADYINKKYKLPETYEERLQRSERVRSLRELKKKNPKAKLLQSEVDLLLDEDAKNKEWQKWHFKNTKPIDNAKELYEEAIKDMTDEQKAMYKEKYKGTYTMFDPETQSVYTYEYFKDIYTEPSDGSEQKAPHYNEFPKKKGSKVKTNDYRNKQWEKLSDKQKEFIEEYANLKAELTADFPSNYNKYQMVQMEEDTVGVFLHRDKNFKKRLGQMFKGIFMRREDDSLEYGDENSIDKNMGGFITRSAPVHYLKPLKDPNILSRDLVGGLFALSQVSFNYQFKAPLAGKLMVLEHQLKNRKVAKGKSPLGQSNSAIKFSKMLDMFFQDIMVDKLEVKVGKRNVDVSKLFNTISNYTRMAGLWMSGGTIVSSAISPRLFEFKEGLLKQYLDLKTSKEATKIYWREIGRTGADGLRNIKKTKINALAEESGIIDLAKKQDRGYFLRENLMWKPYALPTVELGTRMLIGQMLNVKRLPDGTWMPKEFYKGDNWDSLPNLYEEMRVDEDGKLIVPEGAQNVWNRAKVKARDISNRLDGALSKEDKSYLHQHSVLSMIAIFRNFFIRMVSDRFKASGYNHVTDQWDEGSYIAFGKGIYKMMSEGKWFELTKKLAAWNKLTDLEKYGVKSVMYDLAALVTLSTLSLIMHAKVKDIDDEEDKWKYEFLSYLTNRLLLESTAAINPREYMTVLSNPFVPLKYLDYTLSATDLFSGRIVESGTYEGYSVRTRYLLRVIPGVRGYFTTLDPQSSNQFLKTKALEFLPFKSFEEYYNN